MLHRPGPGRVRVQDAEQADAQQTRAPPFVPSRPIREQEPGEESEASRRSSLPGSGKAVEAEPNHDHHHTQNLPSHRPRPPLEIGDLEWLQEGEQHCASTEGCRLPCFCLPEQQAAWSSSSSLPSSQPSQKASPHQSSSLNCCPSE